LKTEFWHLKKAFLKKAFFSRMRSDESDRKN
jgi:hypothetical protein